MTFSSLYLLLSLSAQSGEDLRSIVARTVVEGQVMTELVSLAGEIGPRMSGTKAYDRAAIWAESRFRTHGLEVRLEPVPLAASWKRGAARVRVTAPYELEVIASSAGWSPPTKGAVRGRLRVVSEEVKPGELADSIVLLDVPRLFADGFAKGSRKVERLFPLFVKARVRAVLFPFHNGLKGHRHFAKELIAPLPAIDIPRDLGMSLAAQAMQGDLQIEVKNDSQVGKPVVVQNVIAELPGRGEGWILIGAHLDTWDVTPGAQDNATGVAQVIEAARILTMHANAWGPPRRKIRFALWAAEEVGLLGSATFVERHAQEMASCAAVINTDSGAGEMRGWKTNARTDVEKSLRPYAERLAGIGASEISNELVTNSDNTRFWLRGVPSLDLWIDESNYFDVHHRPNDTVATVRPHRVALGAAALAAMAWMLAEAPEPLAPQLSPEGVSLLIDQLGM
jgi:hypothetical protein